MNAVVLLSGGIDSATTMAIAKTEGYDIYALSFDYGQRHKRELESAKRFADVMGAKKHLIIGFDLKEIGGSALTSEIEVPKKTVLSPQSTTDYRLPTVPITYVPARNTIFLSFALAWAEVMGAEDIFIGANALDYSGYPDCRPEYIKAFENMANLATKVSVEGKVHFRIRVPLISLSKAEIIKRGVELGVNYGMTWSCYDPQLIIPPHPPLEKGGCGDLRPCGKCDSCLFREKGFREAGIRDPLIIT